MASISSSFFRDYSTTNLTYASIVVLGTLGFVYYLLSPKFRFPKNAPKLISNSYPILGGIGFFSKRLDFFQHASSQTPTGNFSFFIGKHPVIGLKGDAGRHAFFNTKALDMAEGYAILFGHSPSNNVGEETGELSSYFSSRIIKMMKKEQLSLSLPYLINDVRARLDELAADPSGITDPFESIYRIVFQLTIRTVGCKEFADDLKVMDTVLGIYEAVEGSSTAATIIFPWFPSPALIRRNISAIRLYMMLNNIIKKRQKTGKREQDPLQYLIDQGDDTTQIISFVLGALFAGILNSGINAAYVLAYLGLNPEWANKCRKEIAEVAAKYTLDKEASLYDQLDYIPMEAWETEFPVMDSCLKDSIRLNLLGSAFRKNISSKPVQVGDEIIPPGAFVTYHLADIHQDPEVYPDPEEWDPTRYSRGEDRKKHQGYLGWGVGRHPCLGMRFAKLEMNIIAAYFLTKFDYKVTDAQGVPRQKLPPIDNNSHSAIKPKERIYFKYTVRE